MADFAENRDFEMVMLVDRTGVGGTELIYDGVRLVFPPNVVEKAIPRFVAQWLYQYPRYMVWTTDGRFVCRFGIKELAPGLAAEIGPDAGDVSPIEVDRTRTEGWDTSGVERADTRVVELRLPRTLTHERQGSTSAATFADRKG